nr:MAG TPA: hypothetical protein [Caudoviricetes sp.]
MSYFQYCVIQNFFKSLPRKNFRPFILLNLGFKRQLLTHLLIVSL